MLATTFTATMVGLQPIKIEVEVDGNRGVPTLLIIGLPTKTVAEAKQRITAALINCGIRIRSKRTIVNLAPADIKKTGSGFELAIAVGLLKMYGEVTCQTDDTIFFGELSLDGTLKPIKGALPLVLAAAQMGFQRVVLPGSNWPEVSTISTIKICPIAHLRDFLLASQTNHPLPVRTPQLYSPRITHSRSTDEYSFSDIIGQTTAKRALEIALAGNHNLLMLGPPGAGKSILAKAALNLLPPLTESESMTVSTIYSICGLTNHGLITSRPFRSPHHTTSRIGLIGGGPQLKPGEITLAHHGVLFLDELPEFSRSSIETLRQPLEDGLITFARSQGSITYPAAFTLIAAANPCPCGYLGSATQPCRCSPHQLQQYQQRLSGPILDRIDLHVFVAAVPITELTRHTEASTQNQISAAHIKTQIAAARNRQSLRYHSLGYSTNAQVPRPHIFPLAQLSSDAQELLGQAAARLQLSARAYFKTINVSRTIADLAVSELVTADHMAEALQYRQPQWLKTGS